MRSAHRDAKQLSGQNIGCSLTTTDIGRATGGQRSVNTLRPTQPEFKNGLVPGGLADSDAWGPAGCAWTNLVTIPNVLIMRAQPI